MTKYSKDSLKANCELRIIDAIKHAEANGFRVVVGSDEECNSWNGIRSESMILDDTHDDYIAITPSLSVYEDVIFKVVNDKLI